LGEGAEQVVKLLDLLWRRPFLWAENAGGAAVAEEGVGDVAGDGDPHAVERAAAGVLDEHHAPEVFADQGFVNIGGADAVENHGDAAGLGAADAGIDGGAATDAEDDVGDVEL